VDRGCVVTRRGYRQTPEHIAKRIKSGPDHWNWAGDEVSRRGGRARALRQYPNRPCEECGAENADRHHADGNTANNEPGNIKFLCDACHGAEHKRMGTHRASESSQLAERAAKLTEAAAAEKRARAKCKRNHLLSGTNLYVTPDGKRVCKECRKLTSRRHRQNRKQG